MVRNREIALICRINAGGFSGERVAQVAVVGGGEQKVLAPRHYCWTKDGQTLAPNEPELGRAIDGLVAARRVQDATNGVVVTTPDGEVFVVPPGIVTARPSTSEITLHVPV